MKRFCPSGLKKPLKYLLEQAWPIAFTQFNLLMFSYTSLPFVGRLDETQMAALGLGTSTVNTFGLSVLLGLFTACETLVSQAYGEMNFKKVSIFCQQSVWIGLVISAPLIAIILNAGSIFKFIGQKEEIVETANSYLLWYLPVIPLTVIYLMLIKFLNCQFIVIPCAIFGLIANIFNVGFHYLFIVILKLGIRGAAISVVLTNVLFTMQLIAYIIYRGLQKHFWNGFSPESLLSWKPYLQLALPGMLMTCLQFWAFEVGMICCAILSKEELNTNLVSLQLISYVFNIYNGLSAACSISVGNALGSGDSDKAKTMGSISFTVSATTGSVVMVLFLGLQSVIPCLFTSLPEIIEKTKRLMPVMAAFQLADAIAAIANGVLRGCGRQTVAAVINLVGYYGLGLPVGISLTFPWGGGLGAMGFWLGLLLAQTAISLLLLFYQFCGIKWDKEVELAKQRLSMQNRNFPKYRKENGENGENAENAENGGAIYESETNMDEPGSQIVLSSPIPVTEEQSEFLSPDNRKTLIKEIDALEEERDLSREICVQIILIVGFVTLTLGAGLVLRLWFAGMISAQELSSVNQVNQTVMLSNQLLSGSYANHTFNHSIT